MSEAVAKIADTSLPAPIVTEGATIISIIERAARDPQVDLDKFERLMSMKERIDKHHALIAFNDAVARAKGEIGPIAKNRTVDFTSQKGRTSYRHEDFAAVAAAVDPVLARHGLSYRFRSTQSAGRLAVTCILSHARGHSEETSLESGEDHSGNKNATQAIGSAATYLQRYTLKLALGLASAHDDDARTSASSAGVITGAQAEILAKLITETKTDIDQFLKFGNVESLSDIPAGQFDKAKALLSAKLAKMRAAP